MPLFIIPKALCKIIAFLAFSLFFFPANAQTGINGKVVDSSGVIVPDATIILESVRDSSLINTIFPDASGVFSWPKNYSFPLLMHISSLGYKEQYILVSDSSQVEKASQIVLIQDKQQLKEVVIQSAKPLLERKIDRIVFNVGSSIVASAGDAMDAIKRSPGVLVKNDAISLAGKGAVKVMVNDRLIQLSGDDLASYLRAIPAGNIDRIEVITTPPAKYDAEGNSGLINIVLKKNTTNGYNGSARLGYQKSKGQRGFGGLNLNYRNDKLNIYGRGNFADGYSKPVEMNTTQFPTQTFSTVDRRKDVSKFIAGTAGMDYEIHKNAIIGIQYDGHTSKPNINENVSSSIYDVNQMLDSISKTNAASVRSNKSNTINLNYDWKIDTTGKRLTANLNHFWYSNDQDRHYNTQGFSDNGLPTNAPEYNATKGHLDIQVSTAQIDMEHPTKWLSLSYGGKLTFINNNSNNLSQYLQGQDYVTDPTRSNIFKYKEQVQALYFNTKKAINKWTFQFGLRGEFTQTTGNSVTLGQINNNKYFKLFPTAYILYTLNEDHVFNFNYSRRINRPDYNYLDPFKWYITPYTYAVGNPFLKPSINDNFEFTYQLKKNYTIGVYYQIEHNSIDQPNVLDTVHNIQYFIRDNIGTSHNYGISFSANVSPLPWWDLQGNMNAYYYKLNSDYYGVAQNLGKPTAYIQWNNSFHLNKEKTIIAECNLFYQLPYRIGFYDGKAQSEVDLGLKALLWNKKASIALSAEDILGTAKFRAYSSQTKTSINNYYDARFVRLVFTYKFGNQNVKEKRDRATGIEAEAGRAR